MSLILDALNRAERERQKSQPLPDIHTRHPLPPAPPEPAAKTSSRLGLMILLAVVLLIAATAVFWWIEKSPAPVPSTRFQTANPAQPARVQPAPVTSITEAPSAGREPSANQEPSANKEPSATKKPAAITESPAANPAPEKNADLAELYAQASQPAEPDAVREPELQRLPQPLTQQPQPSPQPFTEPVVEKTYASLVELPDVGDLPWSLRQEIPSINYSGHNYAEGRVASVVINGQARRASQALASELTLEEIYVDGIVLRFRQTRFKLRALNSWINM